MFPEKLKSRWDGPFVVVKIFDHGAVKILDLKNGLIFTINSQRLKPYLESEHLLKESIILNDPK